MSNTGPRLKSWPQNDTTSETNFPRNNINLEQRLQSIIFLLQCYPDFLNSQFLKAWDNLNQKVFPLVSQTLQ